ncbi:MAG TPA: hypothetical protein DFI00_00705 [Rhodospirillaceae bacterium]|nr:hypothetical protein [Alphaproteobacteria bacterium]OUT40823.1 MAG: hypothetical protein CBB62_00150 [Micavibrio sp. TMED2]HCI45791.1 hypothetical protein [Rhodospirillaceae bacterium]MAS47702.1 hypothetical protein [Alphaproteobacteria bacterium]MAX96426.1 hypothetical protein [Alphaproteobacteria bacterium]|tara:strand:- start:2214 stop:2525 length:312 start_codon:yes stop_codon:yes gene_type:complete
MVPKIEDIIPICGELHKEPVTTDIARRYGLGEDGLSVREQIREQMIARFMRAIRAHRRRLSAARSMKDPELRKLTEGLRFYVLEARGVQGSAGEDWQPQVVSK